MPGWLGASYSSNSVPTALPQQAQSSPLKLVQAQTGAMLARPPLGQFAPVADNIMLTPAGQAGGYYFNVYLNLPDGDAAAFANGSSSAPWAPSNWRRPCITARPR